MSVISTGDALSIIAASANQLQLFLTEGMITPIYTSFRKLYDEAVGGNYPIYVKENVVIENLCRLLKAIPLWNSTIVAKETEEILGGFPHMMDLVRELYRCQVIILAAPRMTSSRKKFTVTIPSKEKFVHYIFTLASKDLVRFPKLFFVTDKTTDEERFKNEKKIKTFIKQAIHQTIRQLLPLSDLICEYLKNDESAPSLHSEPTFYSSGISQQPLSHVVATQTEGPPFMTTTTPTTAAAIPAAESALAHLSINDPTLHNITATASESNVTTASQVKTPQDLLDQVPVKDSSTAATTVPTMVNGEMEAKRLTEQTEQLSKTVIELNNRLKQWRSQSSAFATAPTTATTASTSDIESERKTVTFVDGN